MFSEYFSAYYGVDGSRRDWFDPILGTDTKLFVDPFEIYKEKAGPWGSAHDTIVTYFQHALELLAPVRDMPKSPKYKKVLHLMTFPEPQYFGLGYVAEGQRGAGTGTGFADRMVTAMTIALERGLKNIRHFEELTLLVERVGRDRISDIACNILMPEFIKYTQHECRKLEIPMEVLKVRHGDFDHERQRWITAEECLPKNPVTGLPVLLIPKRFLKELPELNPDDWFDYNAAELRDDFNLDLNERLDKTQIVQAARGRITLVRQWSEAAAQRPGRPYDVEGDPAGLHNWLQLGRYLARKQPLGTTAPQTPEQMMRFIHDCILRFKHFIEQGSGWRLLRNDDTTQPKHEDSIQLLFKGLVESYCEVAGVRLDREVYLGRGPVDFIFAKNARLRVLLEIKKMSSSTFWQGMEHQLTTYMEADDTSHGWYLPIRFGDGAGEKEREKMLQAHVENVREETGFDIRALAIDARRPPSASKIRRA